MAVELGTGYVSLTADAKDLVKQITKQFGDGLDTAGRDGGDHASRGFMESFKSGLGGIGKVVAGALAGGIVAAGGAAIALKGSVDAASDLSESMNKVNVVFDANAAGIIEWSKTSAESFGVSQEAALGAAGTFGNLFTAMGFGTGESEEFSKQLVKNAADLSSFNNANPEDVLIALRAGLTGETEPLRIFGININDARLKAEAYRAGLIEATVDQKKFGTSSEAVDKAARKVGETLKKFGEGSVQHSDAVRDLEQAEANLAEVMEGKMPAALTAAQKAQAAYNLIQQDSSNATDDFKNTSDGLANRQRILAAQFENLKATLGQALLPVMQTVVGWLSKRFLPASERLAAVVGPVLATAVEWLVGKLSGLGPVLGEMVGSVKAFVAAFRAGDGDVTSSGMPGFFEQVAYYVRVAVDVVRDLVGRLREVDWSGIFAKAVDFMRPVVAFIGELAATVVELAGKLREVDWQAVFARAVDILTPLVVAVDKVAQAVIDFARKALPPVVAVLSFLAFTVLPPVIDKVSEVAKVVAEVLGPVLGALAPVIGLLADNLDILVPALAVAAGGFVAFKTATAVVGGISTATSAISTLKGVADTFGVSFGKAALEAGKQTETFAKISGPIDTLKGRLSTLGTSLANAGKSIASFAKAAATQVVAGVKAAASAIATAATTLWGYVTAAAAATVAAVKQAATWVATKVAMIATTVATQAMAAAQWLLNAAMNANPIGLIIGALVALTAGIIIAYNESETFRNIIDAIGRFFRDVLWPAIVDVATAVGGFLVDAFNAVKDVIEKVGPVISTLVGWVRDGLIWYFTTYVGVIGTVIGAVRDVIGWLGDKLKAAIDIGVAAVRGYVDAFGWIIDGARNVWTNVQSFFGQIVDFVTGLPGKITTAASGMFNGIKEAFRSAINFIINAWNSLQFSIPGFDPPGPGPTFGGFTLGVPKIQPFADGGIVDTPTLALLGEVKRARPEVVAPEPMLRSLFADELAKAGSRAAIEQHFHDARVNANDASRSLAWALQTMGMV